MDQQDSAAQSILAAFKPVPLVYCDFIAAAIRLALKAESDKPASIVQEVCSVRSDLHPEGGYLVSTKKTLKVFDRNGREYRVTVEEVR